MNHQNIFFAHTDEEIFSCFEVLKQIRPKIKTKEELLERVRKQEEKSTFQILFATDNSNQKKVVAVAGIRIYEKLFWEKILYVDDLVTDEKARSQGYGKKVLNFLEKYAKEKGCQHMQLDSGVQRPETHKFYFREGFHIRGFFFTKEI